MDAQDFRSLQEAYLEVYDEEYNELPVQKMIGQIGRKLKVHDPNYYKPGALTQAKKLVKVMDTHSERKARKNSKLKNEEVDIYDVILSHLLDEGYAETPEAAEAIMVNMSEDWREDIMEGMTMKDFKANRRNNARREASADARKRGHEGKTWADGGRTYSPDEAKSGRANMSDLNRSQRYRVANDPDSEHDDYPSQKTKNPNKLRKQKAMGELG